MTPRPDGRIVVGVDGSRLSLAAVRWAARLAGFTGGPLEAVTVWEFPLRQDERGLVPPALDGFESERRAARILDESLSAALSPTAPAVLRHLKAGPPGPALTAAAEGAAVLVLGSRGRTAPPGAPLGTTSHYCVHHARCTVVVVKE
ncbi:universal stress protein [Kitasatospora sp. NPDC058406]|uniref:universal stress protein n=1 Tax=Streptomycetaceae TaxID=2062 RepID=UPI002E76B423|nr:universal stress protein [Streptomyces sp. BE303]MED7955474.1 universal stress protein [Streptomyces sp. BE303]